MKIELDFDNKVLTIESVELSVVDFMKSIEKVLPTKDMRKEWKLKVSPTTIFSPIYYQYNYQWDRPWWQSPVYIYDQSGNGHNLYNAQSALEEMPYSGTYCLDIQESSVSLTP